MSSSFIFSLFVTILSFNLQSSYSLECTTDALRFSDGRTEQEGRLEVCLRGVWGTVCNNLWSAENTRVACRQLGIGDRGYYLSRFPVGAAQIPILPATFVCTGEEQSLAECARGMPSLQACIHNDDVRLVCLPPETPPECEEGSLRLRGGSSLFGGRLEICQVGLWGTVCAFLWDRNDAMVACRQLGINATAVFTGRHLDGSGPILLSGVECTGDEDNITQCPTNAASSAVLHDSCLHIHDVDIYCSDLTEPECVDGDIQLVDGRNVYEGRVEVCQDGLWGFVCDNSWTKTSGLVACRQAGINATDALFGVFGVSDGPAHLSTVICSGSEQSVFNCPHESSSDQNLNCYQSEPVGVVCIVENVTVSECDERSVRLVEGSSGLPTEDSGLVEVCMNEHWARVCYITWDRIEATVVCRQLGFPSTDVIGFLADPADEYTGQMVSASCSNTAEGVTLYDCIDQYSCWSLEYAAVICNSSESTCTDGELQLRDSDQTNGGRLEMCYFGVWGTICDDNWIISNAVVACRQLGFSSKGARFTYRYSPRGSGPVILDRVLCSGAEETLLECSHNALNVHDCGWFESVGLYCFEEEALPTDSRIVTTPPIMLESSAFDATPVILATIGVLVLLLTVVGLVLAGMCILRRRASKVLLSSTNARFSMEELNTEADNTDGARNNEYNINAGPSVSLRANSAATTLAPSHVRVRGSFIRQLTDDFIIPLMNLTLLVKIGEGEFGMVYKASLLGVARIEIVAVKTLKGSYSEEEVDSMLEESLKLKHFHHRNVLSLIGVCVEASPAPFIVMPFMSNGSLLKYLRQEKLALVLNNQTDEEIVANVTKRLTTMCQQISKGMKYLAREKFVHRDLAARNCMIDEHYVIKIADFGLSEDIYSKTYFRQVESHTPVKLPVKWMALESLQEGVFSEKSDVWSFGITCWEVFSGGKNPYPGVSPMGLVDMLDQGERLGPPTNAACTNKMYTLMTSCWELCPDERPTFASMNMLLDNYLEELAGYMNVLFPGIQQQEGQTGDQGGQPGGQDRRSKSLGRKEEQPNQLNITISVTSPRGSQHIAND